MKQHYADVKKLLKENRADIKDGKKKAKADSGMIYLGANKKVTDTKKEWMAGKKKAKRVPISKKTAKKIIKLQPKVDAMYKKLFKKPEHTKIIETKAAAKADIKVPKKPKSTGAHTKVIKSQSAKKGIPFENKKTPTLAESDDDHFPDVKALKA